MQFTTAILALLASTGIVAALPGGGGSPTGYKTTTTTSAKLTTACHTTKTCKAVYTTYPEVKKTPFTKVITTTVYKPETVTTEVPSTYLSTEYSKRQSNM